MIFKGGIMVDFYFIGTGGMQPLLKRRLSSAMIRRDGNIVLIDAGEGTQLGIRESGWCAKSISTILLTHLHTDHILGLAGVLLTINNCERTDSIVIAGPVGTKRYVNSLKVVMPDLLFPIHFIEFKEDNEFITSGDFEINAFALKHSVSCYGYSFYLRRFGKFDSEKSEKIDSSYWSELTHGRAVIDRNGKLLTSDDLLGPERRGIKVTYVTDTRPTDNIVHNAYYSDVFICEGMYSGTGEKDEINKIKNYHMTFAEAADLAKKAHVENLILTHFNPAITYPKVFLDMLRELFENSYVATDNLTFSLRFKDDLLSNYLNDTPITIENPNKYYVSFGDRNKNPYKPVIMKYNKKIRALIENPKSTRYGKKRKEL